MEPSSSPSQSSEPTDWQPLQKKAFLATALGMLLLFGGITAFSARDRTLRAELETASFTIHPPRYLTADSALTRGSRIGLAHDIVLYLWSAEPLPRSDRDLIPIASLDTGDILVYQNRTEENRLREDGTGQYFIPIAPGSFLELTDFPPADSP